jgi:type IV pilus assembly protein PilM
MFKKLYVELDTDFIKYVYGKAAGSKVSLKKTGSRAMPEGTFINGRVENKDAFIGILTEIKKELGILSCSANLSLRDGSIITRPLELPLSNEKDIEKHLYLEAEQYLPINRNSYQVSFRIMDKRRGAEEQGSSIMVAAASTENINCLLECFDHCRLHAKVFDVYPNNICRLLRAQEEENIAVIDMGRRGINITITENRSFYMHSYLQVNMDSLIDSYRRTCGMSETEFNNKYYYKEFDFENINNDVAEAEEGLEAVLSEVLGQVSRYLDYFNSRHFGKTVDRVYVIGEYGMLKGLRKIMGYSFRTAVTIGMKPIKQIEYKGNSPFKTVLMSYYSLLGMIMRGSKL